jgi:hypothetical protein
LLPLCRRTQAHDALAHRYFTQPLELTEADQQRLKQPQQPVVAPQPPAVAAAVKDIALESAALSLSSSSSSSSTSLSSSSAAAAASGSTKLAAQTVASAAAAGADVAAQAAEAASAAVVSQPSWENASHLLTYHQPVTMQQHQQLLMCAQPAKQAVGEPTAPSGVAPSDAAAFIRVVQEAYLVSAARAWLHASRLPC